MAFAVVAAHEWMAPVTDRSAEDALWAAHRMGGAPDSEPTWVELALAGLTQHGHASEAAWPYGTPPFPANRPTPAGGLELEALPPWRQIASTTSFADVVATVARGTAVILTIGEVVPAWKEAGFSGVVDAPLGAKAVMNHVVLVVGADSDSQPAGLVIKNSWGTTWGDGGYARLSQRYFEQHVAAIHVLES